MTQCTSTGKIGSPKNGERKSFEKNDATNATAQIFTHRMALPLSSNVPGYRLNK